MPLLSFSGFNGHHIGELVKKLVVGFVSQDLKRSSEKDANYSKISQHIAWCTIAANKRTTKPKHVSRSPKYGLSGKTINCGVNSCLILSPDVHLAWPCPCVFMVGYLNGIESVTEQVFIVGVHWSRWLGEETGGHIYYKHSRDIDISIPDILYYTIGILISMVERCSVKALAYIFS